MKAPSFRILAASLLLALLALGLTAELGVAASWSFAVLGDQRDEGSYGINQVIVEKMALEVSSKNPAFVLCGGDQIHGVFHTGEAHLPDQYDHWKTAMAPILSICYPVRGNHETHGDVNTPGPDYAKYWMDNIANVLTQIPKNGPANEVGMSYSFSKSNVSIIGLEESYTGSWYQVNQPWLNTQLAANTLPFTFVFGHYPAFSFAENLEPGSLADHPVQRDAFWKSLGDSSVNIYFSGHVHSYNRAEISIDGGPEIQQIVLGTGGAPLTTWDGKYSDPRVIPESHLEHKYGYSLVTVDGNKITVDFYAYDSSTDKWSVFDTYSYTMTSRNFGADDANQSLDPATLTDYYQGISLNKIGLGTLTLNSGKSTYSNTITVTAGELDVQGDYSSAPVAVQSGAQIILVDGKVASVTVDSGGTLSGAGTVVGNLTNDGTGNLSSGRLKVGLLETIGSSGSGTFTQSGGTHSVGTYLVLGDSSGGSGTYNLSGGSLTVGLSETIGNSGSGVFTQTGGTHEVTGSLYLGYNTGASGTYNLSDSSLTVGGDEIIGNNGSGAFTETGGTQAVTGNLCLGFNSGANGSYSLSAGLLDPTDGYVGYSGTGAFTQTGGTHEVTGNLYLGYNAGASGTYNLSGASLTVDLSETIGNNGSGVFTQTAGTHEVTGSLYLGYNTGASGTYNLSGGSLTVGSLETIGGSGSGAFTQSGGTHSVGTYLVLGDSSGGSGTFNLSGGSLTVSLSETIGNNGSGAFTQSGGTHVVTGSLYLGYNAGSSGTYNLSGGSLAAGTVNLNAGGNFNQTGGSLNAIIFNQQGGKVQGSLENRGTFNYTSGTFSGRLLNYGTVNFNADFTAANGLANYSATTLSIDAGRSITLSGVGLINEGTMTLAGTLTASQETIGDSGIGSFTQSAGSNSVTGSGALTLAANAGSSGTYNLSGGSLTVDTLNINPQGTFTQTGGTFDGATINQSGGTSTFTDLYLGRNAGGSSIYNFSGGTVTAANEYVGHAGAGTFTQSGGTNTVNNTLILANNTGSSGTYNLSSGSLTVGTLTINTGGAFNQTGGTLNYTTLNLRGGDFTGDLANTGLLAGTGPITGNVTNAGTVSPGSSPGTLNIVGSYTQTTAGTYLAEIASAGSYDKISVTGAPGTATLAGTIAPTLLNGYQPRGNQVFPGVVTTTAGITGAFNTILNQQLGPTLFWQARYNPASVDLWVQRNYTNSGLGLNSNQQGVGGMLNSVAGMTTGDLDTVLNAIDYLPNSANVRDAFKQISPEKAGSLTPLGFAAATFQMRNLATRTTNLRFVQGESGASSGLTSGGLNFKYSKLDGLMLAYNGASLSNLFSARKELQAPESRWGLFVDGGAAFGSQNSSLNQTGYNFTLGGFTAGADYRMLDNLLVGLATGYSNTSSSFFGSGGSVNTNTVPFNAYAAYFPGSLYAYGSLGYALNLFDLKRGLSFGGIARTASSSTTGNQFNLYGETGYDFRMSRFILTPSATLAYSALWVDGFTEQGAGALNLKVASQTADSLQTGLGGRLTVPLQAGSVKVVPQGYAFFQHEFANGSRGLNASLSQGSSTFNFQTDATKRNYALVGAGVTMGLKHNLYAQVNYNAEVGRGNYTAHFVNAGLRLEF